MHIGQELSPCFIDERHFFQNNVDLPVSNGDALPAGFQFLDPGSRDSPFKFEYDSPRVRMSRDLQHKQRVETLYRLAVHDRHKDPLKLFIPLD